MSRSLTLVINLEGLTVLSAELKLTKSMRAKVSSAVVIPLLAIIIIIRYSSYHSVMGLFSRRRTTKCCLVFETNFAVICSKYYTTHIKKCNHKFPSRYLWSYWKRWVGGSRASASAWGSLLGNQSIACRDWTGWHILEPQSPNRCLNESATRHTFQPVFLFCCSA